MIQRKIRLKASWSAALTQRRPACTLAKAFADYQCRETDYQYQATAHDALTRRAVSKKQQGGGLSAGGRFLV